MEARAVTSGEERPSDRWLTPSENARLAVEQDPLCLWLDSQERRHWNEVYKAVVLAPSLEVCEALLRGEKAPRRRLDPQWLKAYGL